MLFSLNYVEECTLYNFFGVPVHFFKEVLSKEEFSNDLFPDWFRDVIDNSPKLREEFITLADSVLSKPIEERKEVYRIFINHNRVNSLCEKPLLGLRDFPDHLIDVAECANKVFDRLYNSTLQGTTVEKKLGESIYDHYEKFRRINVSQVCPFCGLENYPDRLKKSRSQYDHYLKKSKYFFAAVNFKNLIPMCSACNEAPNKHSKDILFDDEGERREFYYPYNVVSGVIASVINVEINQVGQDGKWQVDFVANNQTENDRVSTWREVFNIQERYEARISEESNIWLLEFLFQANLPDDFENLVLWRESLIQWANGLSRMNQIKIVRNGIIKAAYFEYLGAAASDAEIFGIKSLAQSELVQVRNVALG